MEIRIEELQKLIDEKYRGNESWFSEILGISRGRLNQIMNKRVPATSPKAISGIIKYCKENKLDYRKYIKV